jgi:autotransporter-associated beta strand protein
LLDPSDITISSGANSGQAYSGGNFAPSSGAATSVLNTATLQSVLDTATVTVTVSTTNMGTSGSGTGNITIGSTLTWTSASKLILLANGGLTGSGNIVTGGASSNLTINQAGDSTYSGVISGSGSVTKLGAGALTLSSANSYTGGTHFNGGRLILGSAGAIGTSGTLSFGGGTMVHTSSNLTDYSGRFSTASNQAYAVDSSPFAIRWSTPLTSVGGSLTKLGTGRLTLGGANSLSGGIAVNAGALIVGRANAFGTASIAVASGATLDLAGYTVSTANPLSLSGAGLTNYLGVGLTTGALTNSSGSVLASYNGLITLTGDTTIGAASGGGLSLTHTGAITGAFDLTLSNSNNNTAHTINSVIATQTGKVTVNGGIWTFTGNNTYAGGTTITSGQLSISSDSNLGAVPSSPTVNLTLNGNGGVTFTGQNADITISANRSILLASSTSAALNNISPNGTVTIAGDISESGGSRSLNANSRNTGKALILTGNNTFSGGLTIANGTVQIGNGGTTGSLGTGTVTLNSTAARLDFNLSAGAAGLTLANTFNSSNSNHGLIANLGYGSQLDLSGSTLTGFTGIYTASLNENVSPPTIASIRLPDSPSFLNNTYINVLNVDTTGYLASFSSVQAFSWGGTAPNTPSRKLNGGSTLVGLGEQLTYTSTSGLTVASGALWSFLNKSSSGTTTYFYTATDSTNLSITGHGAAITVAPGAPVTYSGVLSNTAAYSLTVQGGGTITLSGANTYTSITTLSGAGTVVKVGSATALGSGAVSVSSGTALDLNGQTLTSPGALSLNGTGVNNGGALMNSGAAATYAGLVSLGSGSGNSIIGGTGAINLSNTGTITGANKPLILGGAAGGSIASVIGTSLFSGTLTKQDAGTWSLNGVNTFTGMVTVNGGTLQIATDRALGAVPGSAAVALTLNGGTLASNNTIDVTLNANRLIAIGINGGSIVNAGTSASTLSLEGAIGGGTVGSVTQGPLTITGGDIRIGANISMGGAWDLLVKSTGNIFQGVAVNNPTPANIVVSTQGTGNVT